MFADPQSVTINAVAISLPRTGSGINQGSFLSADGNVSMAISHQLGKRSRHQIRLNHRKVAADPFDSSLSAQYSMSAYLVVDVPIVGYTVVEQKQVVDGLTAYLSASSGARVTQLLGQES